MSSPGEGVYHAVVLAVAHRQFAGLTDNDLGRLLVPAGGVIYDLKYALPRASATLRL
jgi:hypothetical protein